MNPPNTETKFTIGIPVYNQGRFLGAAIESALKQSFGGSSVLIVDDASTDETPEMVKKFLKDSRVQYIRHSQNRGMVETWNHCLELSSSPYLSILHADDMLTPHFVEKVMMKFEKNSLAGMVFTANVEIAPGKKQTLNFPYAENRDLSCGELIDAIATRGNFIRFPAVALRHPLKTGIGPFDPRLTLTVDMEMWMRINVSWEVEYLPEPLAIYRTHGENASLDFIRNGTEIREIDRAFQILWENTHIDPRQREEIDQKVRLGLMHKMLDQGYQRFLFRYGGWKAVFHSLKETEALCPAIKQKWQYRFLFLLTKFMLKLGL